MMSKETETLVRVLTNKGMTTSDIAEELSLEVEIVEEIQRRLQPYDYFKGKTRRSRDTTGRHQ